MHAQLQPRLLSPPSGPSAAIIASQNDFPCTGDDLPPPPKWGAEPAPAVQSPRRRRRRARGPTPNTTKGGDERVRARFESVRHFLDDVAREFDRVSDLDVLESADGEDARDATKNQ